MKLPRLISLSGPKGSGKDTVARELIQNHGYRKESLSAPLKDAAASIFGWDRAMLDAITEEDRAQRKTPDIWWENKLDWKNHPYSKLCPRFTPEASLQVLGTELFRDLFNPEIWIHSLERRTNSKDKIVITDNRFINEFYALGSIGFKRYEICRGAPPPYYYEVFSLNKRRIKEGMDYAVFYEMLMEIAEKYRAHTSDIEWIGLPFDRILDNNGDIKNTVRQIEMGN